MGPSLLNTSGQMIVNKVAVCQKDGGGNRPISGHSGKDCKLVAQFSGEAVEIFVRKEEKLVRAHALHRFSVQCSKDLEVPFGIRSLGNANLKGSARSFQVVPTAFAHPLDSATRRIPVLEFNGSCLTAREHAHPLVDYLSHTPDNVLAQ